METINFRNVLDLPVVGREAELAAVHAFLAANSPPSALILTGGPGIGKTTLWDWGVSDARERGLRVLMARPSGAEARLAFAALADLLADVGPEELRSLPSPQRRALEVALLRTEPVGPPPEARAIAVGVLAAVRAVGTSSRLLVAVDDVQWLDAPSSEALAFAARRLEGGVVSFLFARRSGSRSALERALEPSGLQRLEVGALSLGATRRILSEQLGLTLPRRVLRAIWESTGGNPLYALELGRAVTERGLPEIGEDIPVPETVEDLLGTRVTRLSGPTRRLLVAVALSDGLRVSELAALAGTPALDDAVDAGVVVVDGDRVRPSHPLLAVAARRRSRASERRALHRELAGVVGGEELRARHLALATSGQDPELAAALAAAAQDVSGRGAAQEAAELAEHALRLTPPEAPERTDRLLALAEHLLVAGEPQRVTDLLSPEVDSLPTGARGRAHLLLSDGEVSSVGVVLDHLDRVLADSSSEPDLQATALARKCEHTVLALVERIPEAEAWMLDALPSARRAGPEVERLVLYSLGWTRILRGQSVHDLSKRFDAGADHAVQIVESLDRVAAVRLAWRGNVHQARSALRRLLSLAEERGEAVSYAILRLHLCELELRAGAWDVAADLLEEWSESSDRELSPAPLYERCRALLAAGRGVRDEVERWAAEAIAGAESTGVGWDLLEAQRAQAIAALLAHEPARAVEHLRPIWEHTEREGVDDPGAFPVVPDLVEGLIELGEIGEAEIVTARIGELAEEQAHPWGLATATRCAGLSSLGFSSDGEEAATAVARAAARYEELGLRFDAARTLLALGRAQRRLRKWGASRRSLEQAAVGFVEIGSEGWAEHARSEQARVAGRRPRATGELTPTERRVAELAAEGSSNKEIALALFVSVHTVEAHLTRAYAKLGARSRTELARRLSAR